jgi:hypothetical protein
MIASESCCFNPKEYRYDLGYSLIQACDAASVKAQGPREWMSDNSSANDYETNRRKHG